MGIPLDTVERLTKTGYGIEGQWISDACLLRNSLDRSVRKVGRWLNLPTDPRLLRHLSQHTGGFVIARDRLSRLVPIETTAMDDRTVIQLDKDDLDALA